MNDTPTTGERFPAPAANDDTKVLHRVSPLHSFPCTSTPKGPFMRVALVDVETTGMDPQSDEIIDMAVVLIRIDAMGRVVDIIDRHQCLRDPGCPIPEQITKITGITDEDVAGAEFDAARFCELLSLADVCVSHNAAFDSRFIERLMPGTTGSAWACSMREFDWVAAGFDGYKLGYLLMQMDRFGDTHRALSDVINLLHVVTFEPDDCGTVLAHVIRSSLRETARVEATRASYHRRLQLKEAGYTWDPERKVWWTEVMRELADLEAAWLEDSILPPRAKARLSLLTSRERYR